MRFIREHACGGIGVEDVLEHVLSRAACSSNYSGRHLDRTIHDAIIDMRLQRVKQLLAETELPLAAIAQRAGFAYEAYLSMVFKRQTGRTPSATVATSPAIGWAATSE